MQQSKEWVSETMVQYQHVIVIQLGGMVTRGRMEIVLGISTPRWEQQETTSFSLT